jgi:hypothetical protein
MSARTFEQIARSGARVSKRELLAALRAYGCEIVPTSNRHISSSGIGRES